MLKAMLEKKLGQPISNGVFAEVMEQTTRDIKYNRMKYGINTNLDYVINAAVTYYKVRMRCA